MNQSVEHRDKIAAEIVRRRVADLLNPQLSWDIQEGTQPVSPQPPRRKTTKSHQQSIMISGDSEATVGRMEKILQEALNSGNLDVGDIQVQVANGNVILRGSQENVKKT